MFCTNCGRETRPKNSACTHCGFDLRSVIALLEAPEDASADARDEIRTALEIAKRASTLGAVISCAYGDSKPEAIKWLKKEKLWEETTPAERKFLSARAPAKARIAMTWKIEALVPLLWAISTIRRMPGLEKQSHAEVLGKALAGPPRLRDEEEIRKEYEKVYRAHWKVRDAERKGKPAPKGLDPEVVQERHYGFNWLTGYMGQSWDDITTDT